MNRFRRVKHQDAHSLEKMPHLCGLLIAYELVFHTFLLFS